MSNLEEKLKEFLEQHPEVARAMEIWANSSAKYEEAMKGFLHMPRVYSGGSTATAPPLTPDSPQ